MACYTLSYIYDFGFSLPKQKALTDLGAGLASEPVKEQVWQLDYVGNK